MHLTAPTLAFLSSLADRGELQPTRPRSLTWRRHSTGTTSTNTRGMQRGGVAAIYKAHPPTPAPCTNFWPCPAVAWPRWRCYVLCSVMFKGNTVHKVQGAV